MEEVNAVMEFVVVLLKCNKYQLSQSDIGVVSPYKHQCDIIRKQCEKIGCKDIRIGSAEAFQGQERKVIIISSVRSGVGSLGNFLKNAQVRHFYHLRMKSLEVLGLYLCCAFFQRFNVMITRAKSLLIVVGNPHLLSQDENWSTFIRFCFRNRCLVQDSKYFRPKKNTSDFQDNFK